MPQNESNDKLLHAIFDRLGTMQNSIDQHGQKLDQHGQKLDQHGQKLDSLQAKYDQHDKALLKIEQLQSQCIAGLRRHDQEFINLSKQFYGMTQPMNEMNGTLIAVNERLHRVESALDLEAETTGGTLGERLQRLEVEVRAIQAKLKAG